MQSLAQLQERLTAAFGPAKPQAMRTADDNLQSKADALPEHRKRPLRSIVSYWLGGAGLIAACLLIFLGQAGGILFLSAGLAFIAVMLIAYAATSSRRTNSHLAAKTGHARAP